MQLLRSGRSLPAARRCLEQAGLTWEAPVLSRNLASLPEPITESPPENSRDGKVSTVLAFQSVLTDANPLSVWLARHWP